MATAKMVGSGWHSQSVRHSNARKYGHAGGRYATANSKALEKKMEKMKQTEEQERLNQLESELDISVKDLQAIEAEVGKIKNVDRDTPFGYGKEITTENGEYMLFKSSDDAENEAKDRVREDLEDTPEMFNSDWLENHIDLEHLKDELESDVNEQNRSYYDDIESENSTTYQNRLVEELVEAGFLEEDDVNDKDGNLLDEVDADKLEKAKEEAVEKKTEDDLDDVMGYLEDIYGKDEARKEAIRIGGIDMDEAVDDAISTDGVAHFLAGYDGNEVEVNGKYLYRTN